MPVRASIPVRRPVRAGRPCSLLAALLAALALAVAGLPPAAAAGGVAGGGERQWIDRPDRIELTEGQTRATISALHCKRDGRENRVVLQRVIDGWWLDVAEQILSASTCETVVWNLGTVQRTLGGQYRLVTRRGTEQVDSVVFLLLVRLRPPAVVQQPVDRTVALGQRVALRSSSGSVAPGPTTHWETSGDGQTWTAIPGATGFDYLTPAATPEMDGTRYRAVHTRVAPSVFELDGVAISEVATLRVRQAPTITAQPSPAAVREGETAVFEAAAVGAPMPAVQWEAAPPGGGFAPVAGATSARLEVPDVTAATDGTRYRAVFGNSEGSVPTADVALTVLLPPQVSRHPQDVVALPGQPVEFRSSVTGPIPSHIGWQVLAPGADAQDGWTGLPGPSGFVHAVVATPELDGARFRAVFGNEIGETVTEPALLTVVVVAPVRLAVEPRVQPVGRLAGW